MKKKNSEFDVSSALEILSYINLIKEAIEGRLLEFKSMLKKIEETPNEDHSFDGLLMIALLMECGQQNHKFMEYYSKLSDQLKDLCDLFMRKVIQSAKTKGV